MSSGRVSRLVRRQVARAVGSGKNPAACEALYRKHTAFLSLPTKFQFEVTFLAMMRDQRASDSQVRPPSKDTLAVSRSIQDVNDAQWAVHHFMAKHTMPLSVMADPLARPSSDTDA